MKRIELDEQLQKQEARDYLINMLKRFEKNPIKPLDTSFEIYKTAEKNDDTWNDDEGEETTDNS